MDGDGGISDDDVATYPTDGVANRDHRGKQVWVCTPGTSHVNVNSSLHLIDLFVEYGTVYSGVWPQRSQPEAHREIRWRYEPR